MNKQLTPLILITIAPWSVFSQYSLTSAGGKSGIVALYDRSLVSYDFASDKATFTYSTDTQPAPERLKNDDVYPTLPTFGRWAFSMAVPIKKNVNSIFGKGEFQPGIELGLDYAFINDDHNSDLVFFGRSVFNVEENKFAEQTSDTTYNIRDENTVVFGLGGGVNIGLSPGTVLSISAVGSLNENSTFNLSSRRVIQSSTSTRDQNGNIVLIEEENEAFNGAPLDYENLEYRLDFSHAFTNTDSENAGFGMLLSLAHNPRTIKGNPVNFSIGPALYPSANYRQILATIQFEFLDIGGEKLDENSMMVDKEFEDIFAIKFYVGLPFTLLGK